MNYLVRIKPLEPYAFGAEKTAAYIGAERIGKGTYLVRSKDVPEQTTILGMLRYIILEKQGLLRSDYGYTQEERRDMKRCIGPDSFQFSSSVKQDFGFIHQVSPVFILNPQNHICIRNPFHNKGNQGCQPMRMAEEMIETSEGSICFPAAGEYQAKEGYGSGYYDLTDGTIYHDLFESVMVTGNRKNGWGDNPDDSFFKRELKRLKKDFVFGVYVEADSLPAKTIAYMGQKRSAFMVTAEETQDESLAIQTEKAFAGAADAWDYALSDIVIDGAVNYSTFAIIEQKQLRNLETIYDEKRHARRLRRSERQYNMIQSGSVFYGRCPLHTANENCRQIGYNQIVRLGGE